VPTSKGEREGKEKGRGELGKGREKGQGRNIRGRTTCMMHPAHYFRPWFGATVFQVDYDI